MSDYLTSVLDELVPTFADEDGDWGRVVADAGAKTPTMTAYTSPLDTTSTSTARRGRPGRWQERWLTRRRLVVIALTTVLAALLVTPGLGIGSRVLDLVQGGSPPEVARPPAWSPDGREIAFMSNHGIDVVSADGSGRRRLTDNADTNAGLSWSPNGRKIAFLRSGGRTSDLYVMNADGSGQRKLGVVLAVVDDPWGNAGIAAPVWSPDGRRLAFRSDRDRNNGEIYVMNADGSGLRRLTRSATLDDAPAWSPDGRKIAFAHAEPDGSGGIYVVIADGSGLRKLAPYTSSGPSWSPNGRKIGFLRVNANVLELYVMNADGSGQRKLMRGVEAPAWSPDGRKIAFVTWRHGKEEIYVMNADGSGLRRLTRSATLDDAPAWSPDGRKIAFFSTRNGNYQLFSMNADGSGQRQLTQRGP